MTSDGYIHEQIMATGLDYAPPVKFLPTPNGSSFALNMNDKVVYTVTGSGCQQCSQRGLVHRPEHSGLRREQLSKRKSKPGWPNRPGNRIRRHSIYRYWQRACGPPVYANSVVALTAKELKVKDWYHPPLAGKALNAGPVVLTYKDKELVAAPGKDGSLVLLDSASLGGADHHTPLAQTDKFSKGAKRGAWESLAELAG